LWTKFSIFLIIIACGGINFSAWSQDSLPNIWELQQSLMDRGYAIKVVDGVYGPNTAAELKEFQKVHDLQISGFLNEETATALRSSPFKLRTISQSKSKQTPPTSTNSNGDDEMTLSSWLWLIFVLWVWWMIFKGVRWIWRKLIGTTKPKTKTILYHDDISFDETDDDLTSFTIEVSQEQNSEKTEHYHNMPASATSSNKHSSTKKTKIESDKCWVPKGQSVTVSGITITNGMLYVGTKLKAQRSYHGTDNCLINPKLKVAWNSNGANEDQMPYWPSYSDIPPKHRRKYLEWLADGAKAPHAYIGYVFLYFYGLERRLFLDQSVQNAGDIIAEIKRLLAIYGDNYSVRRYLGEALSYSSLIQNEATESPKVDSSNNHHWELPLDIRIYIGNKLKQGSAISNDDLLLWFLSHPDKHLRTPATRLKNEFLALMKIRLTAKHPDGPNVRMPRRNITATYSSSSNSFTANLSKLIGDIPDVKGLNTPIKATQKIADDVMEELDKLSRHLGRYPGSVGSMKATGLLPKALIHEFGGDHIRNLQEWILGQHQSHSDAVTFSELIEKSTAHNGSKVTKTIHKEVQQVMVSMGWNMIPAPNEVTGSIKPDTQILLLPVDKGGLAVEEPSAEFLLSIFELTLGSYIAHADTRVLEVEVEHLSTRIESLSHLSKIEKDRLHNYVKWLSIQEADFAAIKRKLKTIDHDAKGAFANIAIAIAAADGQIVPTEVKALEAIYQSMGFDKKELYASLHSMSGTITARSVSATSAQSSNNTGPITLNMELVTATLHDTAKASTLLASIFEDDGPDPVAEPIIEDEEGFAEAESTAFDGLDGPHTQLLQELLERENWPRSDYEKLVISLKLMADGAMETINEWAFNTYDDAIIEDDDPIIIYRELLSEGTK